MGETMEPEYAEGKRKRLVISWGYCGERSKGLNIRFKNQLVTHTLTKDFVGQIFSDCDGCPVKMNSIN